MVEVLSLYFLETTSAAIFSAFLTIGHGDKVAVDIVNKFERIYRNMMYYKDVSGTGNGLEFPHMVEFKSDSCFGCKIMIKYL